MGHMDHISTRKLYENGNQVKTPKFDFLSLDHDRIPGNQQFEGESGISVSSPWGLTDASPEVFPSTNKISQIHVNC